MPHRIKPGHFTARQPGESDFDYNGFTNSMAEKIEEELDALLALDGLPRQPMESDNSEVRDRRRLFVAIARGVVIHLREHHEALTVPVTNDPTLTVEINTEEE
jgi:hypothetical protein